MKTRMIYFSKDNVCVSGGVALVVEEGRLITASVKVAPEEQK